MLVVTVPLFDGEGSSTKIGGNSASSGTNSSSSGTDSVGGCNTTTVSSASSSTSFAVKFPVINNAMVLCALVAVGMGLAILAYDTAVSLHTGFKVVLCCRSNEKENKSKQAGEWTAAEIKAAEEEKAKMRSMRKIDSNRMVV